MAHVINQWGMGAKHTLCGGISATHFPKSKKHIYFCDRKLKFGTVVGTYVYYFGLKFQLDIFSGSGDN